MTWRLQRRLMPSPPHKRERGGEENTDLTCLWSLIHHSASLKDVQCLIIRTKTLPRQILKIGANVNGVSGHPLATLMMSERPPQILHLNYRLRLIGCSLKTKKKKKKKSLGATMLTAPHDHMRVVKIDTCWYGHCINTTACSVLLEMWTVSRKQK